LLGTALREEIGHRGWSVTRLVRSGGGGTGSVQWDPSTGAIDAAGLEGHDVVIHLAGESLAGIWTAAKKRRILQSRVRGTDLLARTLASLKAPPKLLVSSSAIGYYGNRDPDIPLDESAGPGAGFMADVCVRWEAATQPAADAGIRVVLMRTGLVLTPRGGILASILPIYRLGLGAVFGSGRQPWPWLALDDAVGGTLHAIDHESVAGPVNAVAPELVTNEEFTRILAAAVGRFALLRIPAWALRLAPGDMADEALLSGAPVSPGRLLESGYVFRWPKLRPALAAMLS